MAIQWGGTAGHMQVGIDVRTSGYDWTTTHITVWVDYYVRTIAWGADDDQVLNVYTNGALQASWGYHMDSGSGQTTQKFIGTITHGGQPISYGGGPTLTFLGQMSGSNLGGNPGNQINWAMPPRPAGPPTPPGVWISNVGATDAILNVSASADQRGSAVYRYAQEIRTWPGDVLHSAWDGGTRYASPPGLTRATSYYGRSIAFNGAGNSGWAATAPFTTLSTAPSAPQAFAHGLEGPSDVPLSWTAPADNGGQAVTGYTIQASTDPAFGGTPLTQVEGNVLAATMVGLTPGLLYNFRVRARNSVGDGAWSTPIQGTTLATNTVKVPGVGWVPVRAWGRIPGLGWRTLTVWKRPAGSGGVFHT